MFITFPWVFWIDFKHLDGIRDPFPSDQPFQLRIQTFAWRWISSLASNDFPPVGRLVCCKGWQNSHFFWGGDVLGGGKFSVLGCSVGISPHKWMEWTNLQQLLTIASMDTLSPNTQARMFLMILQKKTNSNSPWKMMLGTILSFWNDPFSGDML